MPGLLSRPERGTKVLLFGSQALALDEASAQQLRSTLLDTPAFQWALDAIIDLSQYWDAVCKAVPNLQHIPGAKLLEDLKLWTETGKFKEASFPLPNILLTPLVVITHLTQYEVFLEKAQPGLPASQYSHTSVKDDAETLGLCTGLLSAAAVSSSEDLMQLHHYSAVAVRLAMVVGALTDAQDKLAGVDGEAKSFSAAWSSPEVGAELEEILKRFPDVGNLQGLAFVEVIDADPLFVQAYVSVFLDKHRATVTSSNRDVLSLQQEVKAAGAIVADVSLRGSFHNECHRADLERLIGFCDGHPAFQFVDASSLALPTRSNTGGEHIRSGKLQDVVLRSMLVEQSDWHSVFAKLQASALTHDDSFIVSFGPERCVPPVLARKLGPRLFQAIDFNATKPELSLNSPLTPAGPIKNKEDPSDNAIAIVGMSYQLPSAADLEGF